jgi:large subunit ribosomal protein L13
MMKVYDGTGMILGRLATVAAKEALLGNEVRVVNCEKVIISGTNVFQQEKTKRERRGYPLKSAKFTRMPDRFVRRTIRGMLPWKQSRGKEAFDRVMCHVGMPAEFAGKAETIKMAASSKLPTLEYTSVGEVCKQLGANI